MSLDIQSESHSKESNNDKNQQNQTSSISTHHGTENATTTTQNKSLQASNIVLVKGDVSPSSASNRSRITTQSSESESSVSTIVMSTPLPHHQEVELESSSISSPGSGLNTSQSSMISPRALFFSPEASLGTPQSSTATPQSSIPTPQSLVSVPTPQSSVTTPPENLFKSSGEGTSGGGSNAVTVIEVQSGGEMKNVKSDEIRSSTIPRDNSNRKEPVEGVSITRINVTGESDLPPLRGLNGNQEDGRGSLRFGQGRRHEMDDLDENESEISSVINNPSVISQAPDRYGFMGGEQYTHESEPDPSPEIIRRREMKWLSMMDKWDHFMRKDFKTVRSRCRKGIPRSVRGRAWYYLCGAAFLKNKNPEVFSKLCQQEGKPECIEDIKKDLHRQFPWHEIFAEEGHGQKDLYNVLKSYSILNAKDGYCQAQAPIAAILLMHMPSEDAFWCLVAICEKYLKGYYSPGMQQLQLDGDILFGLLKRVAPPVYKHMKKQKIDPVLYMTEWFLCAFTRTLPWPSVLRVWDSFLCEGVKVLFRVGLVLLKYTLGRTGVLKQCPSMYETLMMLKNLPNYVTHEQFLVVQVQRLDISDDQMRREHYKQVIKRKKAQQKVEAAKKQQQPKSSSVSAGVNNISAASIHKSHETAL